MCVDTKTLLIGLGGAAAVAFTGGAALPGLLPGLAGLGGASAGAAGAAGLFGTGITATQALIGGGALLSTVGGIESSEAESGVADANAAAARAKGYSDEVMQRDDDRRKMATQLAALSERGLSLSSGAPLALMADSARNSELDALQIRSNASSTADAYSYSAAAKRAAIPFTAAGQLLSGATKLSELGAL